MEKKKVLIADDNPTERQGIAKILSSADGITVAGQVEQIDLIMDAVRQVRPDVVLLDLKWDDDEQAGILAARQLKRLYPEIKVVAISVYDHLLPQALQAGAEAALLKGFSGEELLQTI